MTQKASDGNSKKEELTRGNFLQVAFAFVGGMATLAVTGIGARFLVGNAFIDGAKKRVPIAALKDLPAMKVHKLIYSFKTKDAWRDSVKTGTVFAYSEDGENYNVVSGNCTHLGCVVKWQEDRDRYACPCHAGFFDRDGNVISGPPSKPLNQVEAVVEDGKLIVHV
jgi:Rieske Fe-S protein